MTRPLPGALKEIEPIIAGSSGLLILLDFDGTLAPIMPVPEEARMPESTRKLLAAIADEPGITIGILSGRALSDIRERAGVPKLVYAGNHGMEIWKENGLQFVEPSAAVLRPALHAIAGKLTQELSCIPGAIVEDKGVTASVHYRRVEERRRPEIIKAVELAVSRSGRDFRLTHGHMVVEVRPRVNWDKGAAAIWIRGRLGQESGTPVCFGDDATDEDVFRAFPEGITVRVGCVAGSHARFCVESCKQVPGFLRWLASTFRRKRVHV